MMTEWDTISGHRLNSDKDCAICSYKVGNCNSVEICNK